MPDKIDLKLIGPVKEMYRYSIHSDFFAQAERPLIKGGELDVSAEVRRGASDGLFYVKIGINGYVIIECDRCLGDLECPISSENEVKVKFSTHDEDTGDFVFVGREGKLDIGTLIYEFAVLSLPIHPVHEEGQCDADMLERLKGYQ